MSVLPEKERPAVISAALRALGQNALFDETTGGDLSDLGWLSQYRPMPNGLPTENEQDSDTEEAMEQFDDVPENDLSSMMTGMPNRGMPVGYSVLLSEMPAGGKGSRWPKPAFTYSCLIAMALKKSESGKLPVHDIYEFMESNYPYFKTAPDGWKNSVRHNLSLNKWFVKVDPGDKVAKKKGCLWAINEAKRASIEREIAKWSRKNPQAILAAMAKPEDGLNESSTHSSSSQPTPSMQASMQPQRMMMPMAPMPMPYPMMAPGMSMPTATNGDMCQPMMQIPPFMAMMWAGYPMAGMMMPPHMQMGAAPGMQAPTSTDVRQQQPVNAK